MLSQRTIQKYRHQDVALRDVSVPYMIFRYSKVDNYFGSFHVRFTKNGKSTSRVIGRFPLLSIKAARITAIAKRQKIESAKYSSTKARQFKNCGELLIWYHDFRCADTSISLNTKTNVEHHILRVLKPILGSQDLWSLTAGFMSEFWLKSTLKNYKVSTLKSSFQCLKAAFNKAHKLGYIDTNPLDRVSFTDISASKIKPRENRIQFWSIQKLTSLIKGLPPDIKLLSLLIGVGLAILAI